MMKFQVTAKTTAKIKPILLLSLVFSLISGNTFAADVQGNVDQGASKVRLCAGCHAIPGYRSSVPEIYTVPMIGGQSAGYIVAALQAYKKGERKHPTMRSVAGSLSDQDMADLGAYYAAQNADSKPNKLK
jgi:cytochrome c553